VLLLTAFYFSDIILSSSLIPSVRLCIQLERLSQTITGTLTPPLQIAQQQQQHCRRVADRSARHRHRTLLLRRWRDHDAGGAAVAGLAAALLQVLAEETEPACRVAQNMDLLLRVVDGGASLL
jgi:hypothetical protein